MLIRDHVDGAVSISLKAMGDAAWSNLARRLTL